eukprot:2415964-Alexandrium_andersonii.AAC.1
MNGLTREFALSFLAAHGQPRAFPQACVSISTLPSRPACGNLRRPRPTSAEIRFGRGALLQRPASA